MCDFAHVFVFVFLQQLYQTLSDFDIRFYMYEILKVGFSFGLFFFLLFKMIPNVFLQYSLKTIH